MPRKIKSKQEGRFAKNRKARQMLPRSVWNGLADVALDRWIARHDCDGTCEGPGSCGHLRRISRIRTAYGRRR